MNDTAKKCRLKIIDHIDITNKFVCFLSKTVFQSLGSWSSFFDGHCLNMLRRYDLMELMC